MTSSKPRFAMASPTVPAAGQITAQVDSTATARPYAIPMITARGPRR